jgi:hypothetical protein
VRDVSSVHSLLLNKLRVRPVSPAPAYRVAAESSSEFFNSLFTLVYHHDLHRWLINSNLSMGRKCNGCLHTRAWSAEKENPDHLHRQKGRLNTV